MTLPLLRLEHDNGSSSSSSSSEWHSASLAAADAAPIPYLAARVVAVRLGRTSQAPQAGRRCQLQQRARQPSCCVPVRHPQPARGWWVDLYCGVAQRLQLQ